MASAARPAIGYHAAEAQREDEAKWVQADLGRSAALAQMEGDGDVGGFGVGSKLALQGLATLNYAFTPGIEGCGKRRSCLVVCKRDLAKDREITSPRSGFERKTS